MAAGDLVGRDPGPLAAENDIENVEKHSESPPLERCRREAGLHALAGGTVLWLVATWAHIPLTGWPAGIWRWLG